MVEFKIIAIGSSAGGLLPLIDIIKSLPNPFAAAIILVPHLLNNKKSNLSSIVAMNTDIPIIKVTGSTEIQKGFIYVLGEGKIMTVKNNFLIIRERLLVERVNQCINLFFISLAEDARENAIGVILSGGGDDGTEGAKAIEFCGGTVLVQQPQTAEFKYMPESMIRNDHPDYVLNPSQIAEKLLKFITPL